MLTRDRPLASPDQYYADSLLIKPSTTSSVFNNLAQGIATPIVALNNLDGQLAKSPEGQAVASSLRAIDLENETPGIGWKQWLAIQGSGMLGMALNPLTWAAGEIGAGAAAGLISGAAKIAPDAAAVFMRKPIKDLLGEPISKYIPAAIGKEGAEKPLSLALFGEKELEAAGAFAGASVPQAIMNNYRMDTNHIEWGGVAREAGEMGAFGMAIGSIPFAWGVLRGKINRGLGRDDAGVIDHASLKEALDKGHITKAEHDWYSDYLEYQQNPHDEKLKEKLNKDGSVLINENGHTANTVSNEALFEILTPDDVSNLHGVIADQLVGGVPEQYERALSDFIIHNRMDFIRQKPEWLDGVRGYVDFVNKKLEAKTEKLAEADRILESHLEKGVKENMPFSQKELLKMIKKFGMESSHIKNIPLTIPENILKHVKQLEKINHLKNKQKQITGKGKPANKQTSKRISDLKSKLEPILTPRQELLELKQELLGQQGAYSGLETKSSFQRLSDLSHSWHNARTLLDHVQLRRQYERQEAFRDLAHEVLRISSSDLPKIAQPENVVDYLKKRIESNVAKLEPIAKVQESVTKSQEVPADSDAILNDQDLQVKQSAAEDAKKEFVQSSEKFKEFKESSDNIFKNLIACVMGGLNG